jgi:hypothetical protein
MILKSNATKSSILNEGSYSATVSTIVFKPNETKPKSVLIGFKIQNHDEDVVKQVPASFESGAILRKDVEAILGRKLTDTEVYEGLDHNKLVDKECQIVVMHKAGAGGKKVPAVGLILPMPAAAVIEPVVPAVAQPAVLTMPVQVVAAVPQPAAAIVQPAVATIPQPAVATIPQPAVATIPQPAVAAVSQPVIAAIPQPAVVAVPQQVAA